MRVRTLFFGALKDLMARESQSVELPESATVEHLLRIFMDDHPEARKFLGSLAVAVNREYAPAAQPLRDGDEVALLPPVSGGSPDPPNENTCDEKFLVRIQREPIRTDELLSQLKAGEDGAIVVFDGIVRNHSRGRRTLYLDYEAYEEMALTQMRSAVAEAQLRFAVRSIALVHRLGRLGIGETSVWICVASAHRASAFDACRWVIDTLKKTVPIWKKETFEDGAVWADGEPFPGEIVMRSDTAE